MKTRFKTSTEENNNINGIINNKNLRNNQNYMLSSKKISKIIGNKNKISDNFKYLQKDNLYFFSNKFLNKSSEIQSWDKMAIFLYYIFVLFMLIINWMDIKYVFFIIIFFIIITYIHKKFENRTGRKKSLLYKNYKLYFIRDTEWIYYYIK